MSSVAVYDVDSKIPNLALMKLSQWHKQQGDSVEFYQPLWLDSYDRVYASKVFNFSDDSMLLEGRMVIGGTGYDLKVELPPEVERTPPDYSLYDYPHSMGFAMRGCRFNCKFCVVPEKEGRPVSSNTISQIWNRDQSDFVVLLDNDFFGNPEWEVRIGEIRDLGLRVNFSQGLNIRLITEEQARAVVSVRFRNLSGKKKQVHFAWDRFNDERWIDQGIERCLGAGLKPYQMAFYVLIGFDTTPEEDLYRVEKLRGLGADPYVMPYDRQDTYQRQFARWVNHKAIFKSVDWQDYKG